MFAIKLFKKILVSLGPIVSVALFIWCALGIRGCYHSLFAKERFVGNMSSVIEEIRSVNNLKVLRVVDAGLGTYPALDNNTDAQARKKNGCVDFQYSGVVDLYVDLSKMAVTHTSNNTYVITLGEILMTPVRELTLTRNLPMDPADKLSVEAYRKFYGPKSVQDKLYNEFAQIQAASVKKSAFSAENVARAKKQTEKLLRLIFAPFVDDKDRDISFRWATSDIATTE